METDANPVISNDLRRRRQILSSFLAAGVVTAAPQFANAANYNRGAGNVRKINMSNQRTGEVLDMIYWVDGNYIRGALAETSHFFRDWRQGKVIEIDPHTIDITAALQKMLRTNESFLLLSGYRTRATNSRLRGAARNSYHTKGMAADLRLSSRSVREMSRAALALGSGGVGTYWRSNFVHVDSGPIRSWTG